MCGAENLHVYEAYLNLAYVWSPYGSHGTKL
uniref:Uncharacterized protein n=1 Tax=Arundo donax TaxID=35708 RepID=A0A0A9HQD3_ARUDO